MAVRIRQNGGQHLLLPVKVTPKGGKDTILPYLTGDEAIRLKVSAPPEDGKANTAVIALLAAVLGIPKSRVTLASGEKSRHKQVAILLSSPAESATLLESLAESMQADRTDCFYWSDYRL